MFFFKFYHRRRVGSETETVSLEKIVMWSAGSVVCLLLVTIVLCSVTAEFSAVRTNINKQFIDANGNTRIFRGVNAVYKIAPWIPSSEGFDSQTTLSELDAQNLKAWGFNVVRLGVMWPGVEPGPAGAVSKDYLDSVQEVVNILAEHDVHVVLDMHQDLFARDYCGEGVADYVVDKCKPFMPEGMPSFPFPVTNETVPLDEDGNPTLDFCLERPFIQWYFTHEVSAMFQCLYENKANLWDDYAGFWKAVATRFVDSPNVLGYELLNEPWLGDIYTYPNLLLPKQTEQKYLEPMYQHIHEAIREVDDRKIIFFEGVTIDYWASGFSQVPGGPEYASRSAIAYHIYCPGANPTLKMNEVCKPIDKEFMTMRQRDAERLGTGLILTEFGATQDGRLDYMNLEDVAQLADSYGSSWMYWQFKYYEDLTTMTPQGESLYSGEGGTVSEGKLKVLSRTYPQVVAGELGSFFFNSHTHVFSMSFTPSVDGPNAGGPTEIYFNGPIHYPHGAMVELKADEGADLTKVYITCSPDKLGVDLQARPNWTLDGTPKTLNLEIRPCSMDDRKLDMCTCPQTVRRDPRELSE